MKAYILILALLLLVAGCSTPKQIINITQNVTPIENVISATFVNVTYEYEIGRASCRERV